jgi:two-component system NarL family sensor kinase
MDTPQNDILKIIYAAASVLGVVIFFTVYILLRIQRRIAELQENRIKAEIETLENERKRIASDMHDELGPMLSAIKLQINHIEPVDETEKNILQKSSGQIDEIIKRFREISYNLLPNTLIRKGLVSAVEEFINRLKDTGSVTIKFSSTPGLKVPKVKEIDIFRIIQEITHNTVKHAKATTLHINMQAIENVIVLETTDNGIGFNYDEKSSGGDGLGLLNVQSRIAVLNAKLNITSEPGKGTTYQIIIPL